MKFTAVKWKKKTKRFEWQSRLFPEKKEQMEKEGNPWIILIDGLPPLGVRIVHSTFHNNLMAIYFHYLYFDITYLKMKFNPLKL